MRTTQAPDRYTTLPDERTLAATVVALEEHGFSVEVVNDVDAARGAVLARVPEGSSVMTNSLKLEDARAYARRTVPSEKFSRSTRSCPAAFTSSSFASRSGSREEAR